MLSRDGLASASPPSCGGCAAAVLSCNRRVRGDAVAPNRHHSWRRASQPPDTWPCELDSLPRRRLPQMPRMPTMPGPHCCYVCCNTQSQSACLRVPPLPWQCTMTEEHVKDHCNLDVLNAATLVENTRDRFVHDKIYTYISQLLIAVNPFKLIDGLYSDAQKEIYKVRREGDPRQSCGTQRCCTPRRLSLLSPPRFQHAAESSPVEICARVPPLCRHQGANWAQLEPHVYAIAEMSFQYMTIHNQSQSLLVSQQRRRRARSQPLSQLSVRPSVRPHRGPTFAVTRSGRVPPPTDAIGTGTDTIGTGGAAAHGA